MGNKSRQKRLRIFAGPNGSGKSTLAANLIDSDDQRIKLGKFINADEIEKSFKDNGFCSFDAYTDELVTTKELREFILKKGMSPNKLANSKVQELIHVESNKVFYKGEMNSYICADIAAFLRLKLIEIGENFSFETVFSHESKIDIIKEANKEGYRVYLYYANTEDVEININRVKLRVSKGGHDVPEEAIVNRYNRSIDVISKAIPLCYRTFLFDNSSKVMHFILEIDHQYNIKPSEAVDKSIVQVPDWVNQLFEKMQ